MESNFVIFFMVLAASLCTPAAAETDCSVHPDPVDPKTCCPIPDFFAEEIVEKCQEFDVPMMFPPPFKANEAQEDDSSRPRPRPHPHPHPHPHSHPHPHPRPHPHHHPCFYSCALNETGIIDSDQILDADVIIEYIESTFEGEDEIWIPVFKTSFATCLVKLEEVRAFRAERQMSSGTASQQQMFTPPCSMDAGFLMACVFMETFQNCPSSSWNDTDECNNHLAFFTDCQPKFGKHRGQSVTEENSV